MPSRRPRQQPQPDYPSPNDGETDEMRAADRMLAGMTEATASIVIDVKVALGIRSDYALAKALGVQKATVSRWSTGKGGMSDEVALRAAALTGRDPAFYLLRLQLDRAQGIGVQAVLLPIVQELDQKGRVVLRKMRRVAASILLGTALVLGLAALPAQRVAAAPSEDGSGSLFIKSNRRRIPWRRFGRWLGTPAHRRFAPLLTFRSVIAAAN